MKSLIRRQSSNALMFTILSGVSYSVLTAAAAAPDPFTGLDRVPNDHNSGCAACQYTQQPLDGGPSLIDRQTRK